MFGNEAAQASIGDAQAAAAMKKSGKKPIAFDITEMNFEHLRRKRAFYNGVNIQLEEEKDKDKVLDFTDLPDILPVKAKGKEYDGVKYDQLVRTTKSEEEQKAAAAAAAEEVKGADDGETAGKAPYTPPSHLFDYDHSTPAERQELITRFELIPKKLVKYRPEGTTDVKMVAIIVNTNSGKGAGVMDTIAPLLDISEVPYQVHLTEKALDPFRIAQSLDLANYSVLAVAGGDGSINEALNGMLAREDGVRIPLAVIPNGANNDIAVSLGIYSVQTAVAYLQHAEAVAIDTTKMLIDRDDEAGLPSDESRMKQARHMLSGSSLSMPAKIESGASGMKGMCGQSSYSIASMFQALTCGFVQDTYDVEVDEQKFSSEGTTLMCVNNSKNSSGGMIINPFAVLNDGLVDITWVTDPAFKGTFGTQGVLDDARSKGGVQAYKGHSTYMRGRKIKIHFQDPNSQDKELELSTETGEVGGAGTNLVSADGEELSYQGSITWECMPGAVDIIVDTSGYFLDAKTFERALDDSTKESRIINQIVDKIWREFDKDGNGYLDRDETRLFLQSTMKDLDGEDAYDEAKFDETYDAIDANGDGLMEKAEMAFFIRALLKRATASDA